MKEMKIYKVKVYKIKTSSKTGKEYVKHYTTRFFKTENEIEKFKKDRKSCIDSGIGNRETYKIEIGTFNQFRDEITLTDYSMLFSTTIHPNNRLTKDDLFQGMAVWDATMGHYTQIASCIVNAPDPIVELNKPTRGEIDISKIIHGSDNNIHWCDTNGNRIDDHTLFRYQPDPFKFIFDIRV